MERKRLLEELRLQDLRRYGAGPTEAYYKLLRKRIDEYDPEGKKVHAIAEKIDKQGD